MSSPQEIWSLRLQKELLALTTATTTNTNNTDGQEESKEKTSDSAIHTIGILPPFITVQNHELNIEKGVCTVDFQVEVEPGVNEKKVEAEENGGGGGGGDDTKEEGEEAKKEESSEESGEANETDASETKTEDDSTADATKETEPTTEETPTKPTEESTTATSTAPPTIQTVVITLDASLDLTNTTQSSTNITNPTPTYPFQKPKAILTTGDHLFSSNSKIQNGDTLQIDCDWTPSLHLNDAILNLSLKIRECIKREEPYYSAKYAQSQPRWMDSMSSLGVNMEMVVPEEISKSVNQSTAKVSSFFSSLKNKASAMADELDKAVGDSTENTSDASSATVNTAATTAAAAAATSQEPKISRLRGLGKKKKKEVQPPKTKPKPPAKVITEANVEIGDVIDLASTPWNKAIGLYPCKAIRRPEFIEIAIKDVVAMGGENGRKVAGTGIVGAGSMFRSFRQSAKSLVEETFLMLTEEHILEIKCNKFAVANATVVFVIPVSSLAKLKFRRQESLSLFFKQAVDDPIIYMCESSADAVKQLQNILKRYGVKGKHTNASMQRSVQLAMQMIGEIEVREMELEESPSRERVEEIMDLYRLAAENFELAGDARHEEVMSRLHEFLARPLTMSVLDDGKGGASKVKVSEAVEQVQKRDVMLEPSDSDDKGTESSVAVDPKSEQEVAETVKTVETKQEDVTTERTVREEEEETTETVVETAKEETITEKAADEETEDFDKVLQAAEDMMKDAHDDLKDLGIDDDDDDVNVDDLDVALPGDASGDGANDLFSELEDMYNDADKEFQELLESS